MLIYQLPREFVIFDMEWVAWEGSLRRNWFGLDEFPEIFNIGAVEVHSLGPFDFSEESSRSWMTELKVVPKLTDYSVKLSKITQEELDREAVPFETAVSELAEFAAERPMYFWGNDWFLSDAAVMERNLIHKSLESPFWLGQMQDIRPYFAARGVPVERYSSSNIPKHFKVEPPKNPHRGENDARSVLWALNAQ